MTVTQRYTPPFAKEDVDHVVLDFAPVMVAGETITAAEVTTSGGFTVDGTATAIGTVNSSGVFTSSADGTYVLAKLTANTLGAWTVTFEVQLSSGRNLHRTLRVDVAPRS